MMKQHAALLARLGQRVESREEQKDYFVQSLTVLRQAVSQMEPVLEDVMSLTPVSEVRIDSVYIY